MPKPKPEGWCLTYPDPRSSARFLFSMPPGMLRDLHMLSRVNGRGVSTSEMLRQMIAQATREFIEARPEVAKSFKGELPTSVDSP